MSVESGRKSECFLFSVLKIAILGPLLGHAASIVSTLTTAMAYAFLTLFQGAPREVLTELERDKKELQRLRECVVCGKVTPHPDRTKKSLEFTLSKYVSVIRSTG